MAAFLCAAAEARVCTEEARLARLVEQHRLMREHMPTSMLDRPGVWRALLPAMPLTALLRNLNKMTAVGLLSAAPEAAEAVRMVVEKLSSAEALRAARVHPFSVLLALRTYALGRGVRGGLSWEPVPALVAALEQAFYAAFRHLQPTGKRLVLALDVSGSMSSPMMGSVLSSREAAAAVLMAFLRTETAPCRVVGFCHQLVDLPFTAASSLQDIVDATSRLPFGATDCAQPMLWALEHGVQADAFVVLTDNETNYGAVAPSAALRQYRQAMSIPARLVVLATAASAFTVADPADGGMLDVAGMDSAVPGLVADFLADKL